jgi:hypothetical protein
MLIGIIKIVGYAIVDIAALVLSSKLEGGDE